MPPQTISVRGIDDDFKQAIMAAGRRDKLYDLSSIIRQALRRYIGDDTPPPRVGELEARLARTEAERDTALAELRLRDTRYQASPENTFATMLENAGQGNPVTPAGLAEATGLTIQQVRVRLGALYAKGYVTRTGKGEYVPAAGRDVRAGLREIHGRMNRLFREAGGTREPKHPARPPVPEPRKPPAAAGAPARQATVAALRERAGERKMPLVAASELPAAPVFRAGPGVDCLHENLRGVKGVCPDCKQWVGRKP